MIDIIDPWILAQVQALLPKFSIWIIVLVGWFVLLWEEIMHTIEKGNDTIYIFSWPTELMSIVQNNIAGVIVDGSIYRSMLVSLTRHLPYFKELNAGIYFTIEFMIGKNPLKSGYALSSLIVKCILGYYLVCMDNIVRSMIVHLLFTLSISLITFGYRKLFMKERDMLPNIMGGVNIPWIAPDSISINVTKLKRSNSCNDVRKPVNIFEWDNNLMSNNRLISKDKLKADVLESINRYDTIVKNNEMIKFKKKFGDITTMFIE
jgi:hypothetical protein